MLKQVSIAAILAVVTASGACAADAMTVGDTAKGKTLVSSNAMTLYTFDKDRDGSRPATDPVPPTGRR